MENPYDHGKKAELAPSSVSFIHHSPFTNLKEGK